MDGAVSTSMDKLVELLKERGSIKVGEAAKELDSDKSRIESWARMLEKAGAVEIHYSVVGGATIKKGKAFDSVVCAEGYKVKGLKDNLGYVHDAVTGTKEAKTPTAKAQQNTKCDASNMYSLIRKDIDDEEQMLVDDIDKLKREQEAIAKCMEHIVVEGEHLKEKIDILKKAVEASEHKIEAKKDE
jgi:hypothetical protein